MRSHVSRGAVAIAGLGLGAGLVVAAPAAQAATNVIQVRPAELIDPQGTSGSATMQFLAEGIHIKTTNNSTDAARGHFKVGLPLNQVHSVDYEWFGTSSQPAILYDIDINGDGKADGELVGELFYGGKDVWLNDTAAFPAATLTPLSPCGGTFGQTPQNGNQDGCSPPNGAGSAVHGTLDDWARSLAAAGKTANIVSGGFVANGLIYDGVLRSATYGPNQYVFTNTAKSKVTVTAKAKHAKIHKANKAKFSGHVEPVGAGAKVSLALKKNGKWTTVKSRTLAANGDFRFGDKPAKVGVNRYRVEVTETNSTLAAKSSTVKVTVVK
jgi:hypothetical protein